MLHVVPLIIQALNEFHGFLRIDVARADEKSETGARSGRVLLGVLLPYASADDVVAFLEEHGSADEDARADAVGVELDLRERAKSEGTRQRRIAAGKARVKKALESGDDDV